MDLNYATAKVCHWQKNKDDPIVPCDFVATWAFFWEFVEVDVTTDKSASTGVS